LEGFKEIIIGGVYKRRNLWAGQALESVLQLIWFVGQYVDVVGVIRCM
jgi:hypothetical protein